MKPMVSVVVPVYNLEFYIERCLESLATQSFGQFEVLVVNDGGSDDSQLIIDEYVERFPSVFRSFVKPNGGHGSACNFGIERAVGDWVMIVDGDDFLPPSAIEFMYEKAIESGCDLLIGNLLYVFSSHTQPYKPIICDREQMLKDEDREKLYCNWPTPCARLYHRSLFDDPDVRFLDGVIFADANFVPKSYLAARSIYYVDKELYNYDITRPTQSLKQTDKRILNIIPVLNDMLDFYRKKGVFEEHREQLLHYVTRHCVAWIQRIKTLHGYPRLSALQEVFAVADSAFGDEWVSSGAIYQSFGRRIYWQVRIARMFGYRPIIWGWRLSKLLSDSDAGVERGLGFPLSLYRRLKVRARPMLSQWLGA